MKKISKKEIVRQVKKEYKIARQWCEHDFGRYYKMMLDTDDGEIWSDIFLSENEWKEYQKKSIMELDAFPGYVHEMESAYTENAIQKLKTAGWKIGE